MIRHPVRYQFGHHGSGRTTRKYFSQCVAKQSAVGCRRSEFVLLSVSTLSRRARSPDQGGRSANYQRSWTRAVGWQVSQHLSLCMDFTSPIEDMMLWYGSSAPLDCKIQNRHTISSSESNSLPYLSDALGLHLDSAGISALSTPLPASATCMCCSHVAQSAPVSKTRCTQYLQ